MLPMLSWNHESRASAQKMLEHPWLDMPDNYDFKYTDREYEVMMLKKELKNQMKGGASTVQDEAVLEDRQEMNELVDSDPELYAADTEDTRQKKKRSETSKNDGAGAFILTAPIGQNTASDNAIFNDIFDEDEISLEDPAEAREHLKERKA